MSAISVAVERLVPRLWHSPALLPALVGVSYLGAITTILLLKNTIHDPQWRRARRIICACMLVPGLMTGYYVVHEMPHSAGETVYPGGIWRNGPRIGRSPDFYYETVVIPRADRLDFALGFSENGAKQGYDDFSCILRLAADGRMQAYDGDLNAYSVDRAVDYHKDHAYRIQIHINGNTHRYSAAVIDDKGKKYCLADQFLFRKRHTGTMILDNVGRRMDTTIFDTPESAVEVREAKVIDF